MPVGRAVLCAPQHGGIGRRARIARDIHDEIGASLTQISLLAELGGSQPADQQQVQGTFSRIGSRARATVGALDEIVWAANPRNSNTWGGSPARNGEDSRDAIVKPFSGSSV
jgi:hypothetical protein